MFSSLVLSLALCAASSSDWAERFDPDEFKVYRPSEFFQQFSSPYYREMSGLNPQNHEQIRRLWNFMQNNGIPIGIGTNPNNHTIFELYLPMVSRPDGMVETVIGVTKNSGVGNLYFLDHDAVHHVVGIPGVRLSDLEDREASKKKLIEIFLLKEQVASMHSIVDFIRDYWNWRDRERHGRVREDFVSHNRGILGFGDIPREAMVDIVGDFVFGRSVAYGKELAKYFDRQWTIDARTAGVPLAAPDFYPYIGLSLESWLLKFAIPIAEPLHAHFREVGSKGFMAYSTSMADFMLQDWYVEWSDRFQIGIPLDQLKVRAQEHLKIEKANGLMGDESMASDSEFDRKFLMNEVAYFGRRIAEFREMGRLNRLNHYEAHIDSTASNFYDAATGLYNAISTAKNSSEDELASFRAQYSGLVSACEQELPLKTHLPAHEEQPFIQYHDYWKSMTGLLIPRYGHNSGAYSTTYLRDHISLEKRAKSSWKDYFKLKLQNFLAGTQIGRPDVWNLQVELASHYDEKQNEVPRFFEDTIHGPPLSLYLAKLSGLQQALQFQIDEVVIPQLKESRALSIEEKKLVFESLKLFTMAMFISSNSLESEYRLTYLSKNTSAARADLFRQRESRFNVFVDRSLNLIWKMVSAHQRGARASEMLGLSNSLSGIARHYANLESSFSASASENITQIFPKSRYRWAAIGETVKNLFGRSRHSMMDIIERAVRPFRFVRGDRQSSAKFIGWTPTSTPGTNHYILNLNHDQGLLEVHLAYQVFKELGVKKIFVLTTKKAAWSITPRGKSPGEQIVYIEETKPLDELVKRVTANSGEKVGILFCPEGQLPSLSASTPTTSKPGAFVFARKLATHLGASSPVQMISGIFNGHQHYTSQPAVELTLDLSEPVIVPSDPLTRNDTWVAQERLNFENLANAGRSLTHIDLIHPRKASETDFYVSSPLKAYLPIAKWFRGKIFPECAEILRKAGKLKTE